MEWNNRNVRITIGILGGAILFYWSLQNLDTVFGLLGTIIGLLMPFLIGLCIAFFINVPMRAIERTFFEPRKPKKDWSTLIPAKWQKAASPKKNGKLAPKGNGKKVVSTKMRPPLLNGWMQKVRRPVSMVLALVLVIVIILAVMLVVIPEIGNTARTVRQMFPGFLEKVQVWSDQILAALPEASEIELPEINWDNMINSAANFLKAGATNIVGSTLNIANSVFNGLLNFVLGLVFAIYVLLQKEKLCQQAKKVLYALFREERAERILSIARLSNRTFSNFLTGQCLEAVILGLMFFVVMTIGGFPYAMMISVLIGFTALIPVFGAFLGCFVGVLLILVVNPPKALLFLIVFLVLQQIEGNLIYPRVVGSSVGLPGMWVLVAVTLGGNALGVVGMLVMVPICSIVYALVRDGVNHKLVAKGVPSKKWVEVPPKE